MPQTEKERKWDDAYKDANIASAAPAKILSEYSFLLSNQGDALDLACGRAGNAIFLAKKGYHVDAIDNSSIVLEHVTEYSQKAQLDISCIKRDIENDRLSDKKYDVIVVSYFLNRDLSNQIINALKPNGLLFYQTWSQVKCDDAGPSNPNFRLKAGELLDLYAPLTPIVYHEHGALGDLTKGFRNEAMLIAQKS